MQITWTKDLELRTDKALGYVYFLDRTHPLANGQGKVYYHRHVKSLAEGRWLETQEHVHHLDHDRGNNDPSNLEIVSASEHAKMHKPTVHPKRCRECCESFINSRNTTFCSIKCAREAGRKFTPSKEELEDMVWKIPATEVAAHFGVSPSAVQKRCRRLGVRKPGRGYWTKNKNRN